MVDGVISGRDVEETEAEVSLMTDSRDHALLLRDKKCFIKQYIIVTMTESLVLFRSVTRTRRQHFHGHLEIWSDNVYMGF